MKLPTRLRYGLRFLVNLAHHYESGDIISISRVSEEEEISNKYLEQIISSFVRSGIIKGARGKGGGYRLMKDPAEITVLDIANALGEDFTFSSCVKDPSSCDRAQQCPTRELWATFSQNARDLFSDKSLSSFMAVS